MKLSERTPQPQDFDAEDWPPTAIFHRSSVGLTPKDNSPTPSLPPNPEVYEYEHYQCDIH